MFHNVRLNCCLIAIPHQLDDTHRELWCPVITAHKETWVPGWCHRYVTTVKCLGLHFIWLFHVGYKVYNCWLFFSETVILHSWVIQGFDCSFFKWLNGNVVVFQYLTVFFTVLCNSLCHKPHLFTPLNKEQLQLRPAQRNKRAAHGYGINIYQTPQESHLLEMMFWTTFFLLSGLLLLVLLYCNRTR